MALSGNWKQSRAVEAPAYNNLGRGWNPIHATRDGEGRDIAPNRGSSLADVVPTDYTQYGEWDDPAGLDSHFAYNGDDDQTWGYGVTSGTQDRPDLGTRTEQFRDNTTTPLPAWPEWGPYANGVPGGSAIRISDRGSTNSKRSKQRKTETVSEGWENKQHLDTPLDPELPDDAQRIRQTSMMQRDQSRAGSQAAAGRANEERHGISSRIKGMRLKMWSHGERHYDMTPRTAEERIRPWWTRQAGTADPELMQPNEMTVRTPMSRHIPAEPDPGPEAPLVAHTNYGYVGEDVIPYA